ncbi:zinc finger BED domain-containing protein RICESLEEPER 3-like [Phalaenopsis equestris]|uniref:zinc finger BED domain-containing protein RICESLEEPER 3-like n=1 Tax=Phalaenopsis equestris TaxID=78828 RepID=UPI0009E376B6|nr:zinc finger BED domain-containing protein RICESLEEPER 3-like [Phalaenopsis equestris]
MSELHLSQSDSFNNQLLPEAQNSNDIAIHNLPSTEPEVLPQVVIDNSSEEVLNKKGRKRKSTVWEYFVEAIFPIKGIQTTFWQCICCRTKFQKSKTGTTSQPLCHVRECGKIKAKNKEVVGLAEKRQKLLNFMPTDFDADVEIPVFHNSKNYDQHKIREIISKMIIVHEYPFNIVEHTWFNILLKSLNPNYEKVSRNTIKTDCMKLYEIEKEKLKKQFRDIHRFSLTFDCWTSNQTIGYMCLTAHYIDHNWKMQKRIINFIELDPPHTGTFICDVICDCLLEWKIQDKVFAYYANRDNNFSWLPSDLDWKKYDKIRKFLVIFNNVTKTIPALLDPRWKMKFIHFTFSKMYTPVELDSKIKQVEDVMLQIYNTYASNIASSSSAIGNVSLELQSDSVNSQSYDCMLAFTDYVLSSGSIQPSKSDLQVYLEEGLFLANTEHFDILDSWKLNTLKYPCLSKMARDILSVLITIVSSESAFSIGGRVLNDYRSSLSSKTVSALVCSSS